MCVQKGVKLNGIIRIFFRLSTKACEGAVPAYTKKLVITEGLRFKTPVNQGNKSYSTDQIRKGNKTLKILFL